MCNILKLPPDWRRSQRVIDPTADQPTAPRHYRTQRSIRASKTYLITNEAQLVSLRGADTDIA